ncbi:hypothetical protein [Budvicia diplopodorum]|uniref:hypothetical protein n=1 Tax=Budvicia diplopodorum TaxID=1119056 RepID=UPI00135B04BB|nr:hypothetical protein [Budvicia diplopodorum]
MNQAATAMFGGQGDKVIAKILAGKASQKFIQRFMKGAVVEGILEELPQSTLSKMAENYSLQDANPNQDLMKGVINEGLGGMAAGGLAEQASRATGIQINQKTN